MNNHNVLIVEDAVPQAQLLESVIDRFLSDKGIKVLHARNVEQAKQMLHVRGPLSLVILDLNLPDSKPEETMTLIPAFGCPVIALSGVEGNDLRKHAYDYGAIDFLEKPVVTEVLVEKVSRALARHDDNGGRAGFAAIQRQTQRQIARKVTDERSRPAMIKKWLASNAIAILLVGWAVFSWWSGGTMSFGQMQRQIERNTHDLAAEIKNREADKQEQRDTNTRIISRLDEIRGENERSKAERNDIQGELKQVHTTIDNIYGLLVNQGRRQP